MNMSLKIEYVVLPHIYKVNIHVLRLAAHRGVAVAKNRGAEELARAYHLKGGGKQATDPNRPKLAIFFADSHTLFGAGWLPPLLHSLVKYEAKALIYPAIDILAASTDGSDGALFSFSFAVVILICKLAMALDGFQQV